MSRILFEHVTVVTMDPDRRILKDARVLIENSRIAAVGDVPETGPDVEVINGAGAILMPGFVQTHIHLCQTLFRGLADDLLLLDWLRLKIWPMEAAHNPDSLHWSAMLGIAELLASGTTTILDMGTVHHTDHVFKAIESTGLRAIAGACMMDHGDIPSGLRQQTSASLDESMRLMSDWHGKQDGRIRYGFAPRFVLSCSEPLLKEVARLAKQHQVHIHTHASENFDETDLVMRLRGARNISYFEQIGLLSPRTVLAHCVWLDDDEYSALLRTDTAVTHCPNSNLKLGSGIADVPRLLSLGVRVGLGADGAPCNNTLDAFTEMRTAALLQKPRYGPASFPASQVLEMATLGGAKALGLDHEIGSVEVGKRADLILVSLDRLYSAPQAPQSDPVSAIVYTGRPDSVELTMVDGAIVYRNGAHRTLDAAEVRQKASVALAQLLSRM